MPFDYILLPSNSCQIFPTSLSIQFHVLSKNPVKLKKNTKIDFFKKSQTKPKQKAHTKHGVYFVLAEYSPKMFLSASNIILSLLF